MAMQQVYCMVLLGGIHKPRGQLWGCIQMTILLHKPHLVKVTMKGIKNTQNFDHVVYG